MDMCNSFRTSVCVNDRDPVILLDPSPAPVVFELDSLAHYIAGMIGWLRKLRKCSIRTLIRICHMLQLIWISIIWGGHWCGTHRVRWCPSSHLKCAGINNSIRPRSIFAFSPIVPGQVSSVFRKIVLRNQRLLNSLWFRFHWRCGWLRYCWTFGPLLQHCQAPGHWSFWRWRQRRLSNWDHPWWPRAGCCFHHLSGHQRWILSSCCDLHPLLSFYNLSRCACKFWHFTAWAFAFAITTLGDDDEARFDWTARWRTRRLLGEVRELNQTGWMSWRPRPRNLFSLFFLPHWSSSPMTSHLTVARELLKKLSSRMYGYSMVTHTGHLSQQAGSWKGDPLTHWTAQRHVFMSQCLYKL